MALAINVIHGCDTSNGICYQLQLKEIKVLAIEIVFYALYITNKTKHFYFKSERVMQVTEHYRKTRS